MTHDPNELDELMRATARDYNKPEAIPRDAMWERIRAQRAFAQRDGGTVPLGRRRQWWLGAAAAAVLVIGVGIGRVYERWAAPPTAVATAGSATGDQGARTDRRLLDSTGTSDSTSHGSDMASRQVAAADRASRPDVGSPVKPVPPRSPRQPTPDRPGDAHNLTYRVATLEHLAGTEAMLTSFRAAAKRGEVDPEITRWARSLLTTTRLLAATSDDDPAMKRLLGDLELVLLQIGQYTASGTRTAEELELIEHSIERRGVIGKIRTTIPARYTPAGT